MELKMDKKFGRKMLIGIIVAAAAYLWIKETERVKAAVGFVLGLFSPFFVGMAIAFVLNVPMRFFERKLSRIKNEKVLRVTAICLTLLIVLLIITVVIVLLVPQIKQTIHAFTLQLPAFFDEVNRAINNLLANHPQLNDFLGPVASNGGIDWKGLMDKIMEALETSSASLLNNAFALVGDLVNGIYNGVFSFIFAFYCLARKETLARQGRKLLYATVREKRADQVVRILRMSNTVFSNFITGQCLDAVILGLMCAITMALLRMPYIPLICAIIVVTALVPVMGALIGCVIGAFLIFVTSPMQALIFVLMFIIVQQIDNNIVYPRVVGSSIGLPGMWVLLAVLVGEGLMGVAGMLVMVPFASVLYTLLREFAAKRLAARNIEQEKLKPQPPELQPHFVFHIHKGVKKRIDAKKQKKSRDQEEN